MEQRCLKLCTIHQCTLFQRKTSKFNNFLCLWKDIPFFLTSVFFFQPLSTDHLSYREQFSCSNQFPMDKSPALFSCWISCFSQKWGMGWKHYFEMILNMTHIQHIVKKSEHKNVTMIIYFSVNMSVLNQWKYNNQLYVIVHKGSPCA